MVWRGERNSSSPPNQVPCLDQNSHEMDRGKPPFPGSYKKRQRRQYTLRLERSWTASAGYEEEVDTMDFKSTCRRQEQLPTHPI